MHPHQQCFWSGKRDSNSRLQPWQGCALPLNYSRLGNKVVRMKGVEPPRRRRQILSLVRLPIPPHPRLILYLVGGGWWIRTTESDANRFTVCPLWPLGKSSIFGAGDRTRTYNLLITSQLLYQLSHTSILAGITGLEPVTQ